MLGLIRTGTRKSFSIRIIFTGDYSPAGVDVRGLQVDKALLDLFAEADLVVGNLECPLTNRTESAPYLPIVMKAAPEQSPLFDAFGAFSLANNHILDYGTEGAEDTIDYLKNTGKGFFGYGKNMEEALQPFVFSNDSGKVAIFGITRWCTAGLHRAGTCSDRHPKLLRTISNYKSKGFYIVVMPHWDYEYIDYPSPSAYRLAKKLCRAGADLVVGSHSHVPQGFHYLGNSAVFYSLGNFLFHPSFFNPNDSRCRVSILVLLDMRNGACNAHVRFAEWSADYLGLVADANVDKILKRQLKKLSEILHSKRLVSRQFYSHSHVIVKKTNKVFAEMGRNQGLFAVLKRLPKVRLQDLMIKVFDMLQTVSRTNK